MSEPVTIVLSHDEALVLFEFFTRFCDGEEEHLKIRNNAEYLALMRISAQLDKSLVEPFQEEYGDLLEQARRRVAAGYEGLAPGVEPS